MLIGLFYVLAGILLFVHPQLLAFFVAGMFMFLGATMIYMSIYYRRISHRFNDPVIDFMLRL